MQNAVDVAHRLGVPQPIVAMLCAIETVNPEMQATVDAACVAKMAERGAIRGARVEGPLALDNAVSVEAARHKGIKSELAGRADILVAPNIEAANILYKALIFFAKAEEAGIVMGARAPSCLLPAATRPATSCTRLPWVRSRARAEGLRGRAPRQAMYSLNTTMALWPPKPSALDIAARILPL